MSSISKLVKAGTWLTLANVVSKLASALALPLLARMLGPSALGVYSIVFAMAQTGQTVSTLGAETAMHRNGARYRSIGADAVGRLFGVGMILICLVSFLCAAGVWLFREPLAAGWLGRPDLSNWLGAAALLIVLQPLGTIPLLFLASLQEFRAYALRSSLGMLVSGAVTVSLTWKYGLEGAITGLVVGALSQIVWSLLIVQPILRIHGIRLRFNQFFREMRDILSLGFPYYYGNTLLGGLAALPLMGLVARYGGLSDLGYLRVAQSMAAIVGFIPGAIAPAALSYLSASLADDVRAFQQLRLVHLRSVWTLLLVLTLPACLLLQAIIRLMFGSAYQGTYLLAWTSLWLSLLIGVIAVLVQYLVVAGKTIKIAWVCTLGVTSFVGTAYLLVPRYHAMGFLLAQVIGQFVSLPFVLYPVIVELDPAEKALIRNLSLATVVSFFWTFVLFRSGVGVLVMTLLTVGSVFLLSGFLFLKVLSPPERARLKRLVNFRVSYA